MGSLRNILFNMGQLYLKILILFSLFSNQGVFCKKNSKTKPRCNCLQIKELRDITPLYPVMKSWLANKWVLWRNLQQDLGVWSDLRISNLNVAPFITSEEPKLSMKAWVQRDIHYYLSQLESKILTNWIWGPQQNKELVKSIIKPIDKTLFDERNKKVIPKVVSMWKYYLRSILRPEMWLSFVREKLSTFQKIISDERDYEAQYAYGKEIFNDFNYNVGRKLHILKSFIRVWSCLTGSQDYHETKILQLAEKIKLIETIQNYLPVVPSPILQEMFKQTSYNKIKNINLEPVFYQIDSLLDNLSQSLLEQDLYIPYVAGINIWNNLIFGNLPKAESFATHFYETTLSSKFWKKFDSFGMTFYKEFFVKGSERATREITRTILKYIHDKNFSNKTSVNHINDIWENIHQEYEQFDVNGFLQKTINLVLPSHQYDYRQKQKVHI